MTTKTARRPRWLRRALGFPPPSAVALRRRYGTLGALFAPEVPTQALRRAAADRQAREQAHEAALAALDKADRTVVPMPTRQHVTCTCGSVWWTTQVTVDAQTHAVVGYALPLTCNLCRSENHRRA